MFLSYFKQQNEDSRDEAYKMINLTSTREVYYTYMRPAMYRKKRFQNRDKGIAASKKN